MPSELGAHVMYRESINNVSRITGTLGWLARLLGTLGYFGYLCPGGRFQVTAFVLGLPSAPGSLCLS